MDNKQVFPKSVEEMKENWDANYYQALPQSLPSNFQLGESVNLNFHRCGLLAGGKIIKIHFGYGKVLYDIELPVLSEPVPLEQEKEVNYTRIYNVDSVFVEKPLPCSEPQ